MPYTGCSLIHLHAVDPPDRDPPTVVCPAVQSPIYAAPGARESVVTYPDAQATDASGIDSSRYVRIIAKNQYSSIDSTYL